MADLKISQLTALSSVGATDYLPIVDAATSTTKKILASTFKGDKGDTGNTGATGAAGTNGTNGADGISFWNTVPGTPSRVSNTQFTITDTGNAGAYDSLFTKGTVLKWTDTTVKQAMVTSSSYGSDTVTINIMGDILAASATMNTMKYSVVRAKSIQLAIAGSLATGTDLTARYYCPIPLKVYGADGFHKTAGTTNATTYDINKNGSTMFTAKLSIASAATSGVNYTANDGSVTAAGDYISVDCDSVSTTAPIDAYINIFVSPLSDIYL